MYDTCQACNKKEISVPADDTSESLTFIHKWQTAGKESKIRGPAKTVKIMKEITVECRSSSSFRVDESVANGVA